MKLGDEHSLGRRCQAVMNGARPIPARNRSEFLRNLFAELTKHPELGPGIIGRVVMRSSASISPRARGTTSAASRADGEGLKRPMATSPMANR